MSALVSVVIPCFNNERFIGAAVESALKQDYSNLEVIVVNDGSTDKSLQRLDEFGSRITVVNQSNQGAGAARNNGLKLARGKWIKFLDGDDELNPNCVSAQLALAVPGEVIFGDFEFMDEQGLISPHPTHREMAGIRESECIDMRVLLEYWLLISTTLYPKAALQQVGGFRVDVRRGQEFDLHLRMYLAGINFRYREHVCFRYRQHSSPTRISNREYGSRYFENAEHLHRIAALAAAGPRSADLQKNLLLLGQMAWRVGRENLRHGRQEIAKQLFGEAKKLGGSGVIYGREPYRLLAKFLGPSLAEYLSDVSRRRLVSRRFVR